MSAPWVGGTVAAVLDELRASAASSSSSEIVYAAAVGMITALSGDHDQRPAAERLADVATVCQAIRAFEDQGPAPAAEPDGGPEVAHPPVLPGAHPGWCSPSRCTAAPNLPYGRHRSAPVSGNPVGNETIHFAAHLEMFGDVPGQEPRTPDEAWLVLTVDAPNPEIREESGLPLTFVTDRVQASALAGVMDGLVQVTAPNTK